jgi:serine/threonine-protein kinase
MRLSEDQVVDGRYRLIARIGSGGMADVWSADDTELGRRVALKVLHENFARDREFVDRFRREAEAAAGLQHPNVVGVFDRGEVEDSYYIAMELIEGSSLRDLITRGLEVGESVEVARQMLAAASFAHSRGIVHRDLKPLNVLIDREGRIRVTDFGIARAGESEITQTGSVLGTAQYLSPEQAQGKDVTAAADVYAVGVILFEMLTGRVPFIADNAVAIAMKQVSEPPPAPSSINPEVSPALDAVVLKALAKDPADRFASAREMSAALDEAEANPAVGPKTEQYAVLAGPPDEEDEESRRGWKWAAALVALVLIGIGLFLLLGGGGDDGVEVPDVTGESEAAAQIELRDAGFEVASEERPSTVELGTVIETDPGAGESAEAGSTVTIFVSAGPAPTEVPPVKGLSENKARRKLERSGFENVDVVQQSSERVDAGTVIGTDPPAGNEVDPGQTIRLLVSKGSHSVTVPSVVGMNRNDAAATLSNAGFEVNQEPEDSDEPEDQVIRQSPAGDSTAAKGATITIVYSTGQGSIVIDDYVGQKESYAVRKLENQGLQVTTRRQQVDDESEDGIVLSQSPPSGTRMSPGDRVALVVGEFEAPEEPTPPEETP